MKIPLLNIFSTKVMINRLELKNDLIYSSHITVRIFFPLFGDEKEVSLRLQSELCSRR